MKRLKNVKKVLVMALVMVSLFTTQVMAISDPLEYDNYPNKDAGADYNYNESDGGMLSADVSYEVKNSLEAVVGNGNNWDGPDLVPTVLPGETLTITYTVTFNDGYGDGASGTDSIKDLLFIAQDEQENVLVTNPNIDIDSVDGIELPEQDFTATATYKVPSQEGRLELPYALFDYGFFSGTWKSTKSAEGVVALTVEIPEFKEIANLWYTADDTATVYVNGEKYGPTSVEGYADVYTQYIEGLDEVPFVAAKGVDTHGSVAGFKLVFLQAGLSSLITDTTWYFYTGEGEPDDDSQDLKWYEKNYSANPDNWESVTSVGRNDAWAQDADFGLDGDLGAIWIWAETFKEHTSEYFRSAPPATGSLAVTKKVVNYQGDQLFTINIAKENDSENPVKLTFGGSNNPTQELDGLELGTYIITETNPGTNWTVAITGHNSLAVNPSDAYTATIEVSAGTKSTATVTNTYADPNTPPTTGSLKVTKIVERYVGNDDLSFDITIEGPFDSEENPIDEVTVKDLVSFKNGHTELWGGLTPGLYTITENVEGLSDEWSVAITGDDDETPNTATVQVIENQNAEVTVTNTYFVEDNNDDDNTGGGDDNTTPTISRGSREADIELETEEIAAAPIEPVVEEVVQVVEPIEEVILEELILDDPIPEAIIETEDDLVKTSGIPLQAFSLIGVALTGIGAVLRKKNS